MNTELLEWIAEVTITGRILKAIRKYRTFDVDKVVMGIYHDVKGELALDVIQQETLLRIDGLRTKRMIDDAFEFGDIGSELVDHWEKMHGHDGWVLPFMEEQARMFMMEQTPDLQKPMTIH